MRVLPLLSCRPFTYTICDMFIFRKSGRQQSGHHARPQPDDLSAHPTANGARKQRPPVPSWSAS